jgi:hypothetical protein
MTADSQAPGADQWARLIARSFAFEWCGLDAAAGPLRTVCADLVYGVLSQAAAASGGQTLVRLMTGLQTGLAGAASPATAPAFLPGQVSPEEATAQAFARVVCGFLPGELRSVSVLLASATGGPKRKKPPPGAAAATGRWPSVPDLGKQLEKLLEELRATVCGAAAKDIATWFTRVPYQAASSAAVAAAITAAFQALAKTPAGTSGLIGSNRELGNAVHHNLADQVGPEFAGSYADRILVAENEVYLPGSVAPITLDQAMHRLGRAKDYSLTTLAQARRAIGPLYIRAKGSSTSRDDLAVFKFGPASGTFAALSLDGRPEVYEVKAVGSLLEAVSQVTAYSWNYLVASATVQCSVLPGVPGATLRNSVMLPAVPGQQSIDLPVLSLHTLSNLATLGDPASAAAIAGLVAKAVKHVVKVPGCVAVPFMIDGLYGVVPYFVIDLKKVKQLEKTIETIVQALAAALLALMVGLGLQGALRPKVPELVTALVLFCLAVIVALVVIVTLPESLIVLGIAAGVLIVLLAAPGTAGPPPGPGHGELGVHLGALNVQGISADQFGSWLGAAGQLFADIATYGPAAGPVNVNPAG